MRQKLGQHFLKNKEILKKEVAALDLKDGETVIEIGPGRGVVTDELRIRNKELGIIAVEKDAGLAESLKVKFSLDENIEIIQGDILKVLPSIIHNSKFIIPGYKIIGNIPYYLTGFLLRMIGELEQKPRVCIFIIQKEVAERMAMRPPKMNKLAASVQFWATPKILASVPRKDFSPPPEVESALIKLELGIMNYELGKESKAAEEKYYKTVNVLFRQPRKTILNNLTAADLHAELKRERTYTRSEIEKKLKEIGVRPEDRPQDLSVEEIMKISKLEKLF